MFYNLNIDEMYINIDKKHFLFGGYDYSVYI